MIECAGNNDPNNFGLLSVVEWYGVPLEQRTERLRRAGNSYGVLVDGAALPR